MLSRAQDRGSFPVFLKLLDDPAFRTSTISLLARFDTPEISAALVQGFKDFKPAERAATLDALTARPTYAIALLDAVSVGKVPRDQKPRPGEESQDVRLFAPSEIPWKDLAFRSTTDALKDWMVSEGLSRRKGLGKPRA